MLHGFRAVHCRVSKYYVGPRITALVPLLTHAPSTVQLCHSYVRGNLLGVGRLSPGRALRTLNPKPRRLVQARGPELRLTVPPL